MAYILPIVGVSDAALDTGTNSGDVTLTAVGAAPSANSATLAGQALTLQPADATHPGVVTTGTQSIAGAKTFANTLEASGDLVVSGYMKPWGGGIAGRGIPLVIYGQVADGASAVDKVLDTGNAFTTPGAKLLSIKNATVEKASFDLSGKLQLTYTDTSGSPGSATANTVTGRSAIASSATAATITSSCCNATSVVIVTREDNDTTAIQLKCVPAAGSFTVTASATATATTKFRWVIFN